jgi:hypothetical protein
VIQRRTQTADYWQEQFDLDRTSIARLYDLILDKGEALPTATLAQALIGHLCRREEEIIEAELSKGRPYQPKDQYQVGEQIIFPAFDYLLGTVVDERPGHNPAFGEFSVIRVQLEGEDEVREFAAGLQGEHKLNRQDGEDEMLTVGDLLSVGQLYERYGDAIEKKLVARLSEHNEFVQFGDEWFLRDLLVEIEPVHLNIAEALIEIKSMPLPAAEFLPELELPAEVPERIRILSLNNAFEADKRFDNVGDGERVIWYLRRLTPKAVVEPPSWLIPELPPYDRHDIAEELLLIEREIDDEGSGEEVMGPSRPIYRTTMALIYPHWRAGTLPLTVRTRGLFPHATTHHTPVVLVDGQSGDRMQGWVVHENRFVYGLEDWYKKYQLPVGGFIKLARTRDPRVITVDLESRRLKRLWGKVAVVEGGKLTFQVRKLPIACEYDDQLTIAEDNAQAIDALRAAVASRGESLLQIMVRIMPELVKLSPQGTVHAKTIYSAVNILKRMPPGSIFALLSAEPCFVQMGGGYWTFDAALVRP